MCLPVPEKFIFLYGFELQPYILLFPLEEFPLAFIVRKSGGNELPQLLFI